MFIGKENPVGSKIRHSTASNHAGGLDSVQAERLFDRFYTVETARQSSGLGLSIAKLLTERMGGDISAEYRDGILSVSLRFPKNQREMRG